MCVNCSKVVSCRGGMIFSHILCVDGLGVGGMGCVIEMGAVRGVRSWRVVELAGDCSREPWERLAVDCGRAGKFVGMNIRACGLRWLEPVGTIGPSPAGQDIRVGSVNLCEGCRR